MEPSSATSQTPCGEETSSSPAAGSERSAGLASGSPIPTTSETRSPTFAPAGLRPIASATAPAGDREDEPARRAGRAGRAVVRVGGADDVPRALLRRRLVRGAQLAEPVLEVAIAAHEPSSAASIAGRRRSSPRRSRELTVPRGSSRISPISPGVYSST